MCQTSYMKVYYPCPICGSNIVLNYDPGMFSLMIVICLDCGEFRSRTGYAPCAQANITIYDE